MVQELIQQKEGAAANVFEKIDQGDTGDSPVQQSDGNLKMTSIRGPRNVSWEFDSSTSGDPGSNKFSYNNTNQSLATIIRFSELDIDSTDVSDFLASIAIGEAIYVQEKDDSGNAKYWRVIGSTDQGTYAEFDITLISETGVNVDGKIVAQFRQDGGTAALDGAVLVSLLEGSPIIVLPALEDRLVINKAITGLPVATTINNVLGLSSGNGFTINFDANHALFPISNPAAASSRNAHPIMAFDDTTAENVVFEQTIPNAYAGEDIAFDIDWVAETATSGGVTWGVEVEANAEGGNDIDSDSFAAQQTANDTTNGTSGIITTTTITLTQAEADAIAANDHFRFRLQRVVSDGGDDMVGDAQVLKVSVRV